MPMEMTEHICEENIEESYESFDISESDLIKARPQPIQPLTARSFMERNMSPRPERIDERTMIQKINESFFNHEQKVALNSDVDLIKTTKVSKASETSSSNDDKISGKLPLNLDLKLNLINISQSHPTVVRAAGTWIPQNTNTDYESPSKSSSMSSPTDNKHSQSYNDDDSTCDRPFCKLKRKKHEHCDLCNQGFTDAMKLKIHYLKHQQTKLGGLFEDSESDKNDQQSTSSSHMKKEESEPHDLSKNALPNPSILQNLMFPLPHSNAASAMDNLSLQNLQLANLAQLYQQNSLYYQSLYPFIGNQSIPGLGMEQQMPLMQFPFPALASAGGFDFGLSLPNMKSSLLAQKRKLEQFDEMQNIQKKSKISERPKEYQKKSYKDDSVPTGYLKFRFNQDCNFPNCGYRNHQSHFHCCRKDCFYSFCDKTRFVQHTARHERLDKLMGDDFKQFRANMHCGYQNCAYNKNLGPHNKSSHFHCLKCNYICSDTNKVVAHRRQHSKQEYINKAGFRKYSNNEHCNIPDPCSPDGECMYTLKQTHYHCLECSMAVLSRNQLSFHNHRIRPGMSLDDYSVNDMSNDNNILILNDNGSDENSS